MMKDHVIAVLFCIVGLSCSTLVAQRPPASDQEAKQQNEIARHVLGIIQEPLTEYKERWYLGFEIENPPILSERRTFFAPLIDDGGTPAFPRARIIEFSDLNRLPLCSLTPDRYDPKKMSFYVTKGLGPYRVRSIDPDNGKWGVQNDLSILWNWRGTLVDREPTIEPKIESRSGPNGPIKIVPGDWSVFVAIVLGVQPRQVKLKKVSVEYLRSISQ